MNSVIHLALNPSEEARERLNRLRAEFASACNWVAPIAQQNHCWNRVALHHLSYHPLRKAFPELGSQMACNAIHSVCRSYLLLLEHPQSPCYGKKIADGGLPHIHFLEQSPVFFDRHTLSLQKNRLSLFTLEGRLRFGIGLSEADERLFRTQKLREVQLTEAGGNFFLIMTLGGEEVNRAGQVQSDDWPNYLVLKDQPGAQHGFLASADGISGSVGAPNIERKIS